MEGSNMGLGRLQPLIPELGVEAGFTTEEPSPQLGPGVAGVVNVGDAW